VFDISPIQILIVLVIALLVFGPKRLPEMGKSIGRGIREFKGAILDDDDAPRRPPPGVPTRPGGARKSR
jgi:sec-independent protein translocase protein TatA